MGTELDLAVPETNGGTAPVERMWAVFRFPVPYDWWRIGRKQPTTTALEPSTGEVDTDVRLQKAHTGVEAIELVYEAVKANKNEPRSANGQYVAVPFDQPEQVQMVVTGQEAWEVSRTVIKTGSR